MPGFGRLRSGCRSAGACLALVGLVVASLAGCREPSAVAEASQPVLPMAGVALTSLPALAEQADLFDLIHQAPTASTPGDPDWLDERGGVLDYGSPTLEPGRRLVGVSSTPGGYRIVTDDGAVFAYGTATYEGGANVAQPSVPIVGMASTPNGRGYWLASADGGVYTFGRTAFWGALDGPPPAPIVGITATPTGGGYWLAGADGSIFPFGDAVFAGDRTDVPPSNPVVGMAPTPTGVGYWLASTDGRVSPYGDALDLGSVDPDALAGPLVGIAATPSGGGYWLAAADGSVYTFGDATFDGTASSPDPAVAIGARGQRGYWVLHTPRPVVEGPALPEGSGSGRRIVYDNGAQRVWLVEHGDLVVDTYPVSGRRGVPRPGTYSVFSKSAKAYAGHDGISMNNMIRFARGSDLAIGFHSIPRYASGRPLQSEDDLGGFRSAGCVRQADADAERLWDWAPMGTTVVVL